MRSRTVIVLGFVLLSAACRETDVGQEDRARRTDAGRKEAGPGANDSLLVLTPEAMAATDIQTAEVRTGSGWVMARVPGRVEFDPNATAVVQTPLEGRLAEWRVDVGAAIAKGGALGQVESPQNLGTPIVLKAPLGGELIERNATLGDWVRPGDKLALISNSTTVRVVAEVREDLVGRIRSDAPPAIRVLSFPEDTFTGKLLRMLDSRGK